MVDGAVDPDVPIQLALGHFTHAIRIAGAVFGVAVEAIQVNCRISVRRCDAVSIMAASACERLRQRAGAKGKRLNAQREKQKENESATEQRAERYSRSAERSRSPTYG